MTVKSKGEMIGSVGVCYGKNLLCDQSEKVERGVLGKGRTERNGVVINNLRFIYIQLINKRINAMIGHCQERAISLDTLVTRFVVYHINHKANQHNSEYYYIIQTP